MDYKMLNQELEIITIIIIIITVICTIIKKQPVEKTEKQLQLPTKTKSIIKHIAFAIILIIAIITRIYKIDTLLNGLHVDEVGMAYDAFCIANYGVDRYLNKYPVYMINFGGGQSALYTYLAAIIIKILGLNVIAIRLPGIVLSILAIVAGFFMIKKTHGTKSGLLFMCIMIICPWHVMQSRFGLDCNLLSSMITISIALLISSKKWWQYLIAGISFGITLYTYALSYIIVPIVLFLGLLYMLYTHNIKFRHIIILGIPIGILATPLILMLLVNNGYLNQIEWIITIPKLYIYRGEELSFSNISGNIQLFKNIITSDGSIYNSIPQFGTLYIFTIPLVISGIAIAVFETIKSIKNKKFNISAIMLFLFIANMILICLTTMNVNKANSIYISLIYFIFIAIKYIYKNFKIGAIIICIIYIIMATLFFKYYYNDYNNDNPQINLVDSSNAIGLIQRIQEIDKDKTVYLQLNIEQPWIYVLYSLQMSPYEFNKTKSEEHIEYYNNIYTFGRYHFKLPQQIYLNAIYAIKKDNNMKYFADKLIDSGFKTEEYGDYIIFYSDF